MYSDVDPLKPYEIIYTDHAEITCDGGGGALGHPRVFLHIDRSIGQVTCPYCTREFVWRKHSTTNRK